MQRLIPLLLVLDRQNNLVGQLSRIDILRGHSDSTIRWAETAEVSFDTTML